MGLRYQTREMSDGKLEGTKREHPNNTSPADLGKRSAGEKAKKITGLRTLAL
jgi:hypothetical protein